MKGFIGSGLVINVIALVAVTSGDLVVSGGIVGIAQDNAAIGETVAVLRAGVVRVDKASGFAAANGATARYSDSADRLESAGTRVLGVYANDSASADTEAYVLLDAALGDAQAHTERIFVLPKANSAITVPSKAPFDGVLTGLSYYTGAKPTSAAGTVLMTVKAGGNTLLSAANVDAELLTDDAETALTLSAVAADLAVTAGEVVLVNVTSNNADLVPGAGITIFATYVRG